ncbi:DUF2333 family protein [Thermodesulfobacteriota bacterium]
MGENNNSTGDDGGIKAYITRHMLIGVVLAVVVIIVVKIVLGFFEPSEQMLTNTSGVAGRDRVGVNAALPQASHVVPGESALQAGHETPSPAGSGSSSSRNTGSVVQEIPTHGSDTSQPHGVAEKMNVHRVPENSRFAKAPQATDIVHPVEQKTTPTHSPAPGGAAGHATEAHGAGEPETTSFPVEGMTFVDAVIRPLDYELNRRFYGWRPNDILNVTDNVNNFQLGVLEVTRRTAVILAERISRTGSTASFDGNLQNAMNWFMIKAERYWFPSAESKYKAGLKEIRTYFQRLEKGEAQFYSRTDNLIPLLMAYQDLLGSCDENLVKSHEDDGSAVSFFKGDDYFFYAQGVASAMATILEGIVKDFSVMVDRRGGMEELHNAIESCHHAMEIDPWIILNSDLSSLFANHRLNMAAPISHARFYLEVLIRALST